MVLAVPRSSSDMRRIGLTSSAFGWLKEKISSRKHISIQLKTCLCYALIIPIAENTCEPWIILKENERLSEFGIKGLRSKLSINLCDHIQNECIKQPLNVENIIRGIICKKSSGLVISIIYPTSAIHTTQIIVIPSFSSNCIQRRLRGETAKG